MNPGATTWPPASISASRASPAARSSPHREPMPRSRRATAIAPSGAVVRQAPVPYRRCGRSSRIDEIVPRPASRTLSTGRLSRADGRSRPRPVGVERDIEPRPRWPIFAHGLQERVILEQVVLAGVLRRTGRPQPLVADAARSRYSARSRLPEGSRYFSAAAFVSTAIAAAQSLSCQLQLAVFADDEHAPAAAAVQQVVPDRRVADDGAGFELEVALLRSSTPSFSKK